MFSHTHTTAPQETAPKGKTQTHHHKAMHERIQNEKAPNEIESLASNPCIVKTTFEPDFLTKANVTQPSPQDSCAITSRVFDDPNGTAADGPAVPRRCDFDKQDIERKVHLCPSEGDSESVPMGTGDLREWQAQDQGISGDLPERSAVCPIHPVKSEVGVKRHAELSEFLQGHEEKGISEDGQAGTYPHPQEQDTINSKSGRQRVVANRGRATDAGSQDAGPYDRDVKCKAPVE